jgi:phosphatidylglycerophosphate synthase
MPRLPFRIALFLSSYAPLLGLLAWTNRQMPWVWRGLAITALLSVLGLVAVMVSKRGERGPRLVVATSSPDDGDVMAYVATYLLPFLGLDLSKATGIVVFAGFLCVVGVVYVNSNMLFVNPLLSLAGYRTFRVVDNGGTEYRLLTRRMDIDVGASITPAQVSRYVRLEVSR